MLTATVFFFNDTATTEIYTLSLHDALPIWGGARPARRSRLRGLPEDLGWPRRAHLRADRAALDLHRRPPRRDRLRPRARARSEEQTSELQSRQYLVCRLLLEKKNYPITSPS